MRKDRSLSSGLRFFFHHKDTKDTKKSIFFCCRLRVAGLRSAVSKTFMIQRRTMLLSSKPSVSAGINPCTTLPSETWACSPGLQPCPDFAHRLTFLPSYLLLYSRHPAPKRSVLRLPKNLPTTYSLLPTCFWSTYPSTRISSPKRSTRVSLRVRQSFIRSGPLPRQMGTPSLPPRILGA